MSSLRRHHESVAFYESLDRAELAVRVRDEALARSSLAAAEALDLTAEERAALADGFEHVAELVSAELPRSTSV